MRAYDGNRNFECAQVKRTLSGDTFVGLRYIFGPAVLFCCLLIEDLPFRPTTPKAGKHRPGLWEERKG